MSTPATPEEKLN